jgi:hypothetical protein
MLNFTSFTLLAIGQMLVKSAKAARKFMMKLLRWGSISPTFYEQLINTQIPKAQKRMTG